MIHLPLLAHSLNNYHVCLICYKRFVTTVPPPSTVIKVETSLQDEPLNILREEDDEQDDERKPMPRESQVQNDKQSLSSSSSSCRTSEDIYRRFLRFTERYLKLATTSDYFSYHANLLKKNGDCSDRDREDGKLERGHVEAFCPNCGDTISRICDLHQDIEERQLYLLERLDSLGNLMKRSTKKVSTKLEKSLGKVLAQQLNVKAASRVLTFRKVLQLKCIKRMTRNAPMIVVHRGLFPDQWKFSRAATKKELARLIFIFSLAYWSPTTPTATPKISQIPPRLEDSLPNVTTCAEDKNVSKIRRHRRRQAKKPDGLVPPMNADVKMETPGEIIKKEKSEELEDYKAVSDGVHDYDDPTTHSPSPVGYTEDHSDPEWQSQSPPQSPDFQVSSDKEDSSNSSDPDFQASASSKKRTRRVTRRTARTLSTAGDDPPENTSISPSTTPPTKRRRRGRPSRSSPPPPPKDLPFHCDKCPEKAFKNQNGLHRHLRQIHHLTPEYPCEVCGVMVKSSLEMLLHKRKMHQERRGPSKRKMGRRTHSTTVGYECKKCGQFFTNGLDFKEHWRLHSNKVMSEDWGGKRRRNFLEGEEPPNRRKNFQNKLKIKRLQLVRDNKEQWTKCEVCGHQDKGYHLRKHLEDNHEKEDDKKLLCYFCSKTFTVQQTLNLHVRAGHMGVSPKPVFFCHFEDNCEQPFLTWGELHDHMKKHLEGIGDDEVVDEEEKGIEGEVEGGPPGPKKKIFYCDMCGWGTFFENYVDVHKMQHVEQKNGMFNCTKCVAKFERMASLTCHCNRVHGANVQPFKCQLCGVRTSSRVGMDIHINEHKKVEEVEGEREEEGGEWKDYRIKICREEDCGKSFPSMKLLTLHLQIEHKKAAEYNCEICDKRFYWPSLLNYHMRVHREPEFECNICHAKFKKRLTMERHRTEKHLQEEDSEGHLKCSDPDCDKMFLSRNLMHRHLARVHQKGPLVHMCQLCGQIFLNNSGLIAHQRFHDDPQWECDICHKQLKRGITLRYHMDLFHNPDRVYEQFICPTCGKIYKSNLGLKYHMDSAHTEESERKFACPNCPRKYHRGTLLRLHLKNCKASEGEEGQSSFKSKAKGLTKKMMDFRRKQKTNTTSEPLLYQQELEEPMPPPSPENSTEQVTMATTSGHHEEVICIPTSENTNENYQNLHFLNS